MVKLTWPQVNAWRVARQHLSPRSNSPADLAPVAADACGIQAQMMSAADLQFAARVDGLTAADVRAALWERRSLVRTWAMRGTLHIFPADQFPLFCAALGTRTHYRKGAWLRARGLSLDDLDAALEAMRDALDGRTLTREELTDEVIARTGGHLRKIMLSGWAEMLKPAAYQGIICSAPSRGRNVAFARPDQWVEGWRDLDPEEAVQEVLRRFVHMHGPTRPENFAHWWGMAAAQAKRAWRAIEGEFEPADVEGDEAWVLASDASAIRRSKPDTSVRLVPNFDSYVLSYHPRSKFVAARVRDHVFRESAWISPVVLVGGQVAGLWELERTKDRVIVRVQPFARLPAGARKAVRDEADRIGEFLWLEAQTRFEPVTFLKRAADRKRQA